MAKHIEDVNLQGEALSMNSDIKTSRKSLEIATDILDMDQLTHEQESELLSELESCNLIVRAIEYTLLKNGKEAQVIKLLKNYNNRRQVSIANTTIVTMPLTKLTREISPDSTMMLYTSVLKKAKMEDDPQSFMEYLGFKS
jgi:hypothetical protein